MEIDKAIKNVEKLIGLLISDGYTEEFITSVKTVLDRLKKEIDY